MHQAALADLGLDGVYRARRVVATGVEQAAAEVRTGELNGANITMPHKALAARLCDIVEPSAAAAGSVNTWLLSNGKLVGHSTDIEAIRVCCRILPEDAPVVILGAGGAARAALVGLADRVLGVSARRADAACELAGHHSVATIPWGTIPTGCLVVNATPLGMGAEELSAAVLDGARGFFDMAYGPQPTAAVKAAWERRIPTVQGLDMLVEQAALSFWLWTGCIPSRLVMREAAESSQALN